MTGSITVTASGPIATVVLDRPDKLNALTKTMWQALGDAVARLAADPSLRCIVVRGAGERAFSPGNDIAEFARERSNSTQARAYGAVMHAAAQVLADCPVPLVAQIHGEHSRELLAEYGYTPADIDALIAEGVVE